MNAAQAETFGLTIDKGRYMLSVVGVSGCLGDVTQKRCGQNLSVEAFWKGAPRPSGRCVVALARLMNIDQAADQDRVDERTVCCQSNDKVLRIQMTGRFSKPSQNVVQRPTKDGLTGLPQGLHEEIVGRILGSGDNELIEPGASEPLDLSKDHRRPDQISHDLSRQTGRAHTRLEYAADHVGIPPFKAQLTWDITGNQSAKLGVTKARACGYQG